MTRTARIVLTIALVALGIVVVGGIAVVLLVRTALATQDGDAIARAAAEGRAEQLTASLGYWRDATDAESIAAERFTVSDGDVRVVPLAWTDEPEGPARIDVRITADVDALSATQIFGRSHSAGSAERCYQFVVPLYDYVTSTEIDCPDGDAPTPTPTATPEPALPADAEARLGAVLTAADAATLAGDVDAAFPEPELSSEVAVTDDRELVAAVGIPLERECIVMVRHGDGAVERVAFDRIQLEPGEMGCSVALYTAPAL